MVKLPPSVSRNSYPFVGKISSRILSHKVSNSIFSFDFSIPLATLRTFDRNSAKDSKCARLCSAPELSPPAPGRSEIIPTLDRPILRKRYEPSIHIVK